MLQRLPKLEAILQVYAVIAVLLAGWTIAAFLWKLSAWLLLLNPGEIVAIFSYAMAANLVESLSILLVLLIFSVLLPSHILRDAFAVRGSLLASVLILALMVYVGLHMWSGEERAIPPALGPVTVLLLAMLLLGAARQPRVRCAVQTAVLWATDRLIVFLFVLVPIFVLSAGYVLLRNLG
jgi:hypothetical protein